MSTLERYRKCFAVCGIVLPNPHKWSECATAAMVHSPDNFGWQVKDETALCVCRCAAEDWIRNLHDGGGDVGTLVITGDEQPIEASMSWFDGELRGHDCCGHDIHAALIALCYAAVNKKEPSDEAK